MKNFFEGQVFIHGAVTMGEVGRQNPDKNKVRKLLGHIYLIWIHISNFYSISSELKSFTYGHKVTVFTEKGTEGEGGEEGRKGRGEKEERKWRWKGKGKEKEVKKAQNKWVHWAISNLIEKDADCIQ